MWRNCPKPFKEEFKCIKEMAEQQEQLNRPGASEPREATSPSKLRSYRCWYRKYIVGQHVNQHERILVL